MITLWIFNNFYYVIESRMFRLSMLKICSGIKIIFVLSLYITYFSDSISAGIIPLVIKGDAAPRYWNAPVKCGVPFPKGTLFSKENLTLKNGKGEEVPFQSSVMARWSRGSKKSIRWLLIDFLAERGEKYELHYKKGKVKSKKQKVEKTEIAVLQGKKIMIDTGVLKTSCSLRTLDLFGKIKTKDNRTGKFQKGTITGDKRWSGLYIEHETRGLFRADFDREADIKIEENGPIRAAIRAEGNYVNKKGKKFCKYICRIHFFKNKRIIKLEHTFIFTGDSKKDKLRDIAIKMPLAGTPRNSMSSMFSTLAGTDSIIPAAVGSNQHHYYQVMDSADHKSLRWTIHDGKTNEVIPHKGRGEKIGGFFKVWTKKNSLAAVVKDAWQQYPIEFEWEDGDATVHLWPKHGRLWDTSWDGMLYYLSEEQKINNVLNKNKVNEKNLKKILKALREKSNAFAAAKTHETWFFFNEVGYWENEGQQTWDYVHKPVYVHADLEWQTQTKALDYVLHHPLDMKNFSDEENYLSGILSMMEAHVDFVHYYGWWDWGGYNQFLKTSNNGYARDEEKYGPTHVQWHRARPKSHYYWGSFPWLQFFRTGKLEWLDYANRYTNYSSDMAFRHATSRKLGRYKGEEYHYDNSELHWIGGYRGRPGGGSVIVPTCDRDDYLFRYWLTGEKRSYEVLLNWAEQYATTVKKFGKQSFHHRLQEMMPYGNAIRNIGGVLERLCLVYMGTLEKKYLDLAGDLAELHYDFDLHESLESNHRYDDPNPLNIMGNSWYPNWLFQGMFRYAIISGKSKAKKAAIHLSEIYKKINAGMPAAKAQSLNWAVCGYELTKDIEYLDMGKNAIASTIAEGVQKKSFAPGQRKFRVVSMPRMIGALGNSPLDWRNKNLPMDERNEIFLNNFHPQGKHFSTWEGASQAIYILDERDEEFDLQFSALRGGVYTVFDPDGKMVIEPKRILMYRDMNGRFVIPKDGKKGTYTLLCIKQTTDKEFGTKRFYDYIGHLKLLYCSLPKVVYRVPSQAKSVWDRKMFLARGWYFGVPAGKKAEIQWRPDGYEAGGQRHFRIIEWGNPNAREMNTKDMLVVDREGENNYGDYNRYTFDIPRSEDLKIYHCKLLTQKNTFMKDQLQSLSGFVIKGAPAFISETAEAWFEPTLPKKYSYPDVSDL